MKSISALWAPTAVKALIGTLIVFDVVNPFTAKGLPTDEQNRLALDRVKSDSISALRAPTAVIALNLVCHFLAVSPRSPWSNSKMKRNRRY